MRAPHTHTHARRPRRALARAPHLAAALTHGEGFPQLTDAIAEFRELFDWEAAKREGRVIPKPGASKPYDAAEADAKKATGAAAPTSSGASGSMVA